MQSHYPVIDLHCDLLSYLARIPGATPESTSDIGVALPYLRTGKVIIQVLALFTPTQADSTRLVQQQIDAYQFLIKRSDFTPFNFQDLSLLPPSFIDSNTPITVLPALENASGFCEEDEPLDKGLERLTNMITQLQSVLYLSLTHHDENRFGGGNYSANVGLKRDGEALLEFLSDKSIAIDISHASDQLASDIFTYIARYQLNLSVIASHSNFRSVWPHVRNLPDELIKEIVHQNGLIGINFLRAYVDDNQPDTLIDHIAYGLEKAGDNHLALGADFFYTKDFYDPSRFPLYHAQHEHAGQYPDVLRSVSLAGVTDAQLQNISYLNVLNFLKKQQP